MNTKVAEISHPEKVLYPQNRITKKDVAEYYLRVAEYILPYVRRRPVTLRQFPDGIDEEGFYSKHAPDHFPDYIERVDVPMHSKPGEKMEMLLADEAEDLVYFTGQNTIELHVGLARAGNLEKPDQIIFDLDPSDQDFDKVRETAFALKSILDKAKIRAFIKITGSKGVHIHIPLKVEKSFAEIKPLARKIAGRVCDEHPSLATLEQRKNQRRNRVFIDFLRNDYNMTSIAPYSLRALPNAPVATPLDWYELKRKDIGPGSYTLSNIFKRIAQKTDPWKEFEEQRIKPEQLILDA